MKVRTLAVLAGNEACNARCPFCVSKMLPPNDIEMREPEVNWRNFRIACGIAKDCDVIKCLLTSQGEPTLFPKQITDYLRELNGFGFRIIEIQTNGIPIAERSSVFAGFLKRWYELGLTTVAISVVSDDPEENRKIYLPHKNRYIDLPALIQTLHDLNLSVRLACTLIKDCIDDPEDLEKFIGFAKSQAVEQITVRPVSKPGKVKNQQDQEACNWIGQRELSEAQIKNIENYLQTKGVQVLEYSDGVKVFDVDGQNICFASPNWTKLDPETEDVRQLIFCPDGHLRYDWRYPGAILL